MEVFSKEWTQTSANPCGPAMNQVVEISQTPEPNPNVPSSANTSPNSEGGDITKHQADIHKNDTRAFDYAGHISVNIVDFSFVTVHNLLYFIYTGLANLHYGTDPHIKKPDGYPTKADAFELYRIADMYMVQHLAQRCFYYLTHSCTPENICGRLFNVACEPYQDLRKEYIKFLMDNYANVVATVGWKDVLFHTEDLGPVERKYWGELLLEITEKIGTRLPAESTSSK
jgi:BTB/POZ domain